MAMVVAAVVAAEAARAAEAAMAAPTSPSNLRSSRRNGQPIPARAPLRSANYSAGAANTLPALRLIRGRKRVQTGQSKGGAARWAAVLTNRGARLLFAVAGGMYWYLRGYTGKSRARTGIHWTDPVDPLGYCYTLGPIGVGHWTGRGHALGYTGNHWDTLNRPWTPTGIHREGLRNPQEYTEQDLATHWDILGHTVFWDQSTDLTDMETYARVFPPGYCQSQGD